MKGMKLWVFTLVEYDGYGNCTVLRSFVKPAKESPIKQGKSKKVVKAKEQTTGGVTDLWE